MKITAGFSGDRTAIVQQKFTNVHPRTYFVPVLLVLFLSGCSTLAYYWQSISGQLSVMEQARPIDDWLKDQHTPEKLKRRLQMVQQARRYAVQELALPDNDSYRKYADLKRPYVVWNVVATPELSLQPIQSCFPITGCLAYRGYFHKQDAMHYAHKLLKQGNDVYVGGIPAYSTLGWFNDPLLNTMMHWQDYDLVGMLFHELAHQKVYVKNDTRFNEAYAMTVEQEGLSRWMNARGQPQEYKKYLQDRKRYAAFVHMILKARNRLEKLYASKRSPGEKRLGKKHILRGLQQHYRHFRHKWHYSGYDKWMFSGVNNAKIISIATYHDLVPAFRAVLKSVHGDFTRFHAAVKRLARLPKKERHAQLKMYLKQH